MSSSSAQEEEIREAAELLFSTLDESGLCLFLTADKSGKPHATWMATAASAESCEVVTLTSPDSRKVRNIEENPHTEWLFFDEEKSKLVYLNGVSEVVKCQEKIRLYWALMSEKGRAYFLNYYNSGMGFTIVLSRILSVCLVYPQESRKISISPVELWKCQELKT